MLHHIAERFAVLAALRINNRHMYQRIDIKTKDKENFSCPNEPPLHFINLILPPMWVEGSAASTTTLSLEETSPKAPVRALVPVLHADSDIKAQKSCHTATIHSNSLIRS